MDDVRRDVDIRVLPIHERPVHPDLAGPSESHNRSLWNYLSGLGDLVIWRFGDLWVTCAIASSAIAKSPHHEITKLMDAYWDSPQNGQRSARACRGLRQCQQNRGACGVSRAFSRV
jgi:hypothetical protein